MYTVDLHVLIKEIKVLIWIDFGGRVVDVVWLYMRARDKCIAVRGRDDTEVLGQLARSTFKFEPTVKNIEECLSEYSRIDTHLSLWLPARST